MGQQNNIHLGMTSRSPKQHAYVQAPHMEAVEESPNAKAAPPRNIARVAKTHKQQTRGRAHLSRQQEGGCVGAIQTKEGADVVQKLKHVDVLTVICIHQSVISTGHS